MEEDVTLEKFIKKEGGVTAAAKSLKVSRTYLYRLKAREHQPGRLLLDNLKRNGVVYP